MTVLMRGTYTSELAVTGEQQKSSKIGRVANPVDSATMPSSRRNPTNVLTDTANRLHGPSTVDDTSFHFLPNKNGQN